MHLFTSLTTLVVLASLCLLVIVVILVIVELWLPRPSSVITAPVERDINKRWEQGIEHHPKSEELFAALAKIDFELCNDYFCWKSGGDGDNGETFMYQLDIYFECLDRNEPLEK